MSGMIFGRISTETCDSAPSDSMPTKSHGSPALQATNDSTACSGRHALKSLHLPDMSSNATPAHPRATVSNN